MITIRDCGYKAGYSGNDHLLDDQPLQECIGEQFRSVRDVGKRLNKVASETLDRRCATPPIWVEIHGDRVGVQQITV